MAMVNAPKSWRICPNCDAIHKSEACDGCPECIESGAIEFWMSMDAHPMPGMRVVKRKPIPFHNMYESTVRR